MSPAIMLQEAHAHAATHVHLTSSFVDVKGVHTLPVFCWFPVFVLTQPGLVVFSQLFDVEVGPVTLASPLTFLFITAVFTV